MYMLALLANADWLWVSDFVCGLAFIGVIGYHLARQTHWLVGATFGLMAYSAFSVFQNALNGLPFDPVMRLYDHASECAFIWLTLIVAAASFLTLSFWIKFFRVVALVNAALIFLTLNAQLYPWGILFNGSMSGCFSAVLLPLYSRKEEKWRWVFVLLSVFAVRRSLPIAVLFATALPFLNWYQLSISWWALVGTGFLLKGKLFLEDNGRFGIWRDSFRYWSHYIPLWTGSGLGLYYILFQALSASKIIWMHSDWGQILFETGIVGFGAVSALYLFALYRAHQQGKYVLSALLGYGMFAVANMPLRYPLSALYGAFLIRWAFNKRSIYVRAET